MNLKGEYDKGTLWRIRYAFEEWYFKTRYSNKQSKIYYDKWFNCYVHPKLVEGMCRICCK